MSDASHPRLELLGMDKPFRSRNRFLSRIGLALLFAFPHLSPGQSSTGNEADLLQKGAQAIHKGQLADAETDFSEAARANPQSAEALLGLGMTRLREGRGDKAEEPLRRAILLSPSLPGPHLFLGIAQYQQNEIDAAISSFETEVQLQPKNPEALSWLGIAHLARGDASAATGPLDRAGALAPNDADILDLRARAHTQVARECFQKLYDLDPGSWHVHRALAEIYSAGGLPEQAAGEYAIALESQPENPDLYDALGAEYLRSNKLDDAAKTYSRELELNPHSATALLQLGRIHIEKDDPSVGIPLLRRALDDHADPAEGYYFLGLGLMKNGQDKDAAEALESCLKQNPPASIERSTWYTLIRVYRKLNREAEAQRALAEFNRLQATAPRAPR